MQQKSLDEIMTEVLEMPDLPEFAEGRTPITVWLPHEYKEKYEQLQAKSRRKFSKVLREVFKRSIDRACSREEAS